MPINPSTLTFSKAAPQTVPPYDLLLLADPSRELVDAYLPVSEVYTAALDGIIVGVVVLYPINATALEIKNIAVHPAYQGQGIGSYLLQQAEAIAQQQHYRILCIGTADSSIGQLRLYKNHGFTISEIRENFFLNNYEEPIFENGLQARHMVMLEKAIPLHP